MQQMTPWVSVYLPIIWVGGHLSVPEVSTDPYFSIIWANFSLWEFPLRLGKDQLSYEQQGCVSFCAEAQLLNLKKISLVILII